MYVCRLGLWNICAKHCQTMRIQDVIPLNDLIMICYCNRINVAVPVSASHSTNLSFGSIIVLMVWTYIEWQSLRSPQLSFNSRLAIASV